MACILVITEDLEPRRARRRLFVRAGYAVMEARDVREGLHYLQAHVIDLVVLALSIPLDHVVETLQALRMEASAIQILLLIDLGVLGQIDGGLLAQLSSVDQVLSQPVTETALLAAVRTLLALP